MTCAPDAWTVSHKFDRDGVRLLRTHYSRRKPDSPQFMPPGETLVLVTPCKQAVWGWWRPDPRSGMRMMSGYDGWVCSVFHNDSEQRSSDLILAAESVLAQRTALGLTRGPCGPDGLLTYVWRSKVRSSNPGYCYKAAAWVKIGTCKRKTKDLLQKPFALHVAAEALRGQLEAAFSPATAAPGTDSAIPSAGHCAAVSHIFRSRLGGEYVSASVSGVSHWFNRVSVCGRVFDVDLTGDQFGRPPVQVAPAGELYEGARLRRSDELRQETIDRASALEQAASPTHPKGTP